MGGARSPSTGKGCDSVACGAPRPGVAGMGSPGDSLDVGLHLTHRDGGPSSGGPRSGFVLAKMGSSPALPLCGMQDSQNGWVWTPGCTQTPVEPGGAALFCSAEKSTPTEPAAVGSRLGNAACPLRCAVFTGWPGLQQGQRCHVWPQMPLCALCAPAGQDSQPAMSLPRLLPHTHGAGGEMGCREMLVRPAQNKPSLEALQSCCRGRVGSQHLGF